MILKRKSIVLFREAIKLLSPFVLNKQTVYRENGRTMRRSAGKNIINHHGLFGTW